MEKFDISKMDQKLLEEIKACKTPEELKALFAAKQLEVPEIKLDAILKLSEKAAELDLEDMKLISGGCCDLDCKNDCTADHCPRYCRIYCWNDQICDFDVPR